MTGPQVTLRLNADASGVSAALGRAREGLADVGAAGDRAGNQVSAGFGRARQGIESISTQLNRLQGGLTVVASALGGAASLGQLAAMADGYTNLTSKIRLVTASESALVSVREQVFQVAQATRQDLTATADLYTRLARATGDMGLSQQRLLGLTTTINQAFVVSGASAAEAAAAITQLSQGLASGALRGDEFNSVAEQAPILMELLAKQLGVTRGELRKMAEDGKLTADVLVSALGNGAASVAAQFADMDKTIGQSFTYLQNELTKFIGSSAQSSGAAGAISGAIVLLANNLSLVASAVIGVAAVFASRFVASQVAAVAAMVGTRLAARAVAVEMGITATAATTATTAMTALRGAMALVGGPIGLAVLGVSALAVGIYELVKAEEERRQKFEAGVVATDLAADATNRLAESMREASAAPPPALEQALQQQTTATIELIQQQDVLRAKRLEIADLEERIRIQQTSTREGAGVALLSLIPQLEEAQGQYKALADEVSRLEFGIGSLSNELNARLQPALDSANAAGERFGRSLSNWDVSGAIAAIGALGGAFNELGEIVGADQAAQAFANELPKRLKEASEQMASTGKSAHDLTRAWVDAGVAQAIAAGQTDRQVQALRDQGAQLVSVVARTEALRKADQGAAKAARDAESAQRKKLQTLQDMRAEAERYMRAQIGAEQATADFVNALKAEVGDIGKTREELARLNVMRELENKLKAEGADPAVAAARRAEVRAILDEGAAREQAARQQEELLRAQKDAAQEYERTWLQAADSVSYAIGDFITGSIRSFKDLAKQIGDIFKRMLADMIAQWVRSGVARIFAGLFGGGGASSAMAGTGQGAGTFGQFLQGGFAQSVPALAAVAGGLYGFQNRGGSNGSGGSVAGGLAYAGLGYAAGTVALGAGLGAAAGAATGAGIGATAAAGASGAIGAAAALGPVAIALAVAAIIDKISGGKLFGTRFRAENATSTLSIGEGGGTAGLSIGEVRNRSLFRGRQWRSRTVDAGDEARDAAESLFEQIRTIMTDSARQLAIDVPPIIEGAIRTVSEFDKKGKVTSTKIFVDILGRTWEEATAELAATRLSAEAVIATVDAAIGSVQTASASAIAERWRDDAEVLMGGAQFLLAAATDLRNGTALLTEGGLGAVADLVEELAAGGETLSAAYTRLRASTSLLEDALSLSGVSLDLTRENFIRFAADITDAAGGLERAQALWGSYFTNFYTETERLQLALERANTGAATQFTDIGLNASDFTGAGGSVAFREMFERLLPSLSAEAVVEWLEAADALGVVLSAQNAYRNSLGQTGEDLRALVETITALRARIRDDIQGLRAAAPGFDAAGFQRNRITELRGQLGGATPQQQVGLIDQIRQATLDRFNAESEQVRALAASQAEAGQAEDRRRDEAARAAEQAHEEAMRGWEAQQEAARRLRDYVDTLGLSSVSPLTAFQRFDEAQNLYQRALSGNDAAALQQAAQAYLEETRAVYGVSDRAVGIFNEVRGALGGRADALASAAMPTFQSPVLEAAATGTTAAVVNVESAIEALRAQAIADLQGLDTLLATLQVQAEAQFNSELEALNAQFTQAEEHNAVLVDTLGLIDTDQAVRDAEHLAVLREQLAATQALVDQQAANNVVMLQRSDAQAAEQREILAVIREENERMARAIDQSVRSEVRR